MADVVEIRELARKLNLMNIANGVIDITDETVSNLDYVSKIFAAEIELREKKKQLEILVQSKLPKIEFDHSKTDAGFEWQLEKIKSIDFRSAHQNIMILGECLTGKTALATEIGKNAVTMNTRVLYTTTEDFLFSVKKRNTSWNRLLKSDLIILDELFYITPSDEELTLLYKSIMFLNESRSFIFISNRILSDWTNMNTDTHLTDTFRKRILSDSQIIRLS